MKFVDRIDETTRLKDVLSRNVPTFTVIYGRRRLGKSTLIKRVLTENDIYFLADRSENNHQRVMLSRVVAQKMVDFDKFIYQDWESLLLNLNYRAENKFTLCLDEFPYLVEQTPELPSILQKLLDEKMLKYNLVVCGSSQSMMSGLVLDSTAPLYGRAELIMKFTPIKLPYIQEAIGGNEVQAIEEFAVWGGVPRYWELRESQDSLRESIWYNILSVNGTLYEEPAKLFQDDVKDIVKTSTLMSYIGNGANRLSEIATRSDEPSTNLSRPLKKLIDLGFLEREVPFGIDEKNAKKTLYKIADPFMAFYYKFVVPNKSFIELDRRLPIEQSLSSHFSEYVSFWWETLCRNAVTGNMINGILFTKAKRWWGSVLNEEGKPEQIEIDVMAESIDGKHLLVGECKWTSQENAKLLQNELLRKVKLLPFAKKYTLVPALFLKEDPNNRVENIFLPTDVINLFRN